MFFIDTLRYFVFQVFANCQAPEAYEHRGPEDFQNKEDGDSDDSDDGLDVPEYHRMSHTPQPHGTQYAPHLNHQRRTSNDSIMSDRRQSLHHVGTPQLLPHGTPPLHSRHPSLQHINTPPQHFQVPMPPAHGSPQPATSAVRGGMLQQRSMQQDNMGLGMGISTPQPYGVNYNPYGHQQVYLTAQDNPPRRPSSTPNYQYSHEQPNPYQPSPPLPPPQQQSQQQQPPPPQPDPPSQPHITEIKSKGRMKSIHTPVSSRASSLAAHFDTSRSQYERPHPPPPPRSHSVDSIHQQQHQQIIPGNMPLSNSPPPITTTTPGSTSNHSTGQRPKLSLHIPDDEDPSQQAEESGGTATPGTASPEHNRQDREDQSKSERSEETAAAAERRHSQSESFFLPPPNSASSLLPNGRLPGPGLGAFDNSNNSGGTPLSALPSRYAGDMLPSPSTFYPEFYGSLPSAGTSNIRNGYAGMMNGTPVVARAEEAGMGFSGFGEKRKGEELQGTNKRAKN
jgi:transcription factor RLM1